MSEFNSKTINTGACPRCGELFCHGCAKTREEYEQFGRIEQESAKKVRAAIEVICQELNHMGNEKVISNAVAAAISSQHRTLQQLFMNFVVRGAVEVFAFEKSKGFFDARNEDSCILGESLKAVMDEKYLPYLFWFVVLSHTFLEKPRIFVISKKERKGKGNEESSLSNMQWRKECLLSDR